MPAKSQAQYRFMEGVAHGSIKRPSLSPAQAQEWIDITPNVKKLPKRLRKRPKSKRVDES